MCLRAAGIIDGILASVTDGILAGVIDGILAAVAVAAYWL